MSLNYAAEKFSRAVYILATSPGGIKERLVVAFTNQIGFIQKERDIPQPLQDDFASLLNRVTRVPVTVAGEGLIHSTIRAIDIDEAVDIAKEILAFEYELRGRLADERKSGS